MQDWMQHPNLSHMDPEKLALLSSLASQGSQKKQSDVMPFLMSILSGQTGSNLQFSSSETEQIIEVIKLGKSPEEIAKINKMIHLLRMLKR